MSSADECGLQKGCFGMSDFEGSDTGSKDLIGVPVDSIATVMLSPPQSVKEQLPVDECGVPEDKEICHSPAESRSTPIPNHNSAGDLMIGKSNAVEENNKTKQALPSSADEGVEGDEKANVGTEGTELDSSSSSKSSVVVGLNESSLPLPADVNVEDDDRADGFVGNGRNLADSGKKDRLFAVLEVMRELEKNHKEDTSIYGKTLLQVAEGKWGPFGSF